MRTRGSFNQAMALLCARRLAWLLFALSSSLLSVRGQPGCLTDQLENTTELTSLIQAVFTSADNPTPPDIDVHAQQIVCLAAAQDRGQWQWASQVVSYFCNGALPASSPLGGSCSDNFTSQFDFQCDPSGPEWIRAITTLISAGSGDNFFNPADASLVTPLRDNCSFCVDPSIGGALSLTVDSATHCAACSDQCLDPPSGLGRCTSPQAGDCCNFYEADVCVVNCSASLAAGGPTGTDCLADCGPLFDPSNGDVSLGGTTVGEVANYSCEGGFVLVGAQSRTCQPNGQWSGTAPNCRGLMIAVSGDPHFSILLPTGQLLCYSVHGEKGFSFNLIANNLMIMNALFIPDPQREEVTWIGSLGIVVKGVSYRGSNETKIRFEAGERKIYIGDKVALEADRVGSLSFGGGRLTISHSGGRKSSDKRLHEIRVDLLDPGLSFSVQFVKFHLGLSWRKVQQQQRDLHGLIGQFLRGGTEIDEARKLLLLPSLPPVPVMRRQVWHFLEGEVPPDDQLCWAAMNPGYQGKRLIEGQILDYLVDNVLLEDFKFEGKLENST